MRVMTKADGDALASRIASHVCQCKTAKHIIVADGPTMDVKDEAMQSAISYWMMGWSWDEIETVLEDSEYTPAVISYAIKETKAYARKILNEGPFAMMTAGQGVKLSSGEIGTLEDVHSDHLVVQMGEDIGVARIGAAHVDIEATNKLGQAFEMRIKAEQLLSTIDADSRLICEAQVVEESNEEPLVNGIADSLESLHAIKQASDNLKRVAQQSYDEWSATKGDKAKSDNELGFLQYLSATVTQEKELDNEVNALVYDKLVIGLENLHDAIVASKHSSDEVSLTKEAVQKYLTEELPSIIRSVESHVYEMDRKNSKIGEYAQQFDKFDAQLAEKGEWAIDASSWAKDVWDTTKKCVEHWNDTMVPVVEKGIGLVSACFDAIAKAQKTGKVEQAMKQEGF